MGVPEKMTGQEAAELKVVSGGVSLDKKESDELEIDLVDLALVLLDKLYYIIFFMLLGAVLLNAFAYFCVAPTYESTAKMYIVSASDDSVVDLTDLNIGTSLTADYEELMMSYPVLDQVIEKMNLDMDYSELAKMITITNPSDTRILVVTVASKDPELSRDIANTVVTVATDYLPRTMGTEEPNIAQVARVAEHKSKPSYAQYTIIGALVGLLLCCGFFIVRYMLDDTVHTAEDVEKYFGIVPLTSIPDIAAVNESHEKKKKKQARRKK